MKSASMEMRHNKGSHNSRRTKQQQHQIYHDAKKSETHSIRINLLAKQVLKTSGILSKLPNEWFLDRNDDTVHNRDTSGSSRSFSSGTGREENNELCYVQALERVLDMDGDDESNNCDKKRRSIENKESEQSCGTLSTCTDFNSPSSFSNKNNNKSISNHAASATTMHEFNYQDSNPPQIWSPAIDSQCTNDLSLTSTKTNMMDIPLLKDMAPFSKTFYISVGQLLSFVYNDNQSILSNIHIKKLYSNGDNDERGDYNGDRETGSIAKQALLERYTLGRNVFTVRMTHVLSSLMELSVHGSGAVGNMYDPIDSDSIRKGKLTCALPKDEEDNVKSVSFLDLLLYHAEQNTNIDLDYLNDSSNQEENCNQEIHNDDEESPVYHVAFIQSLFKHYSTLPQLESHIYAIVRLYRTCSGTNINAKVQHMKSSQILQEKLESEFEFYVSTLESILGCIYSTCDVTLRQKFKLRMGHFLTSFVMGASSSTSYCGGGRIRGGISMGVENTSAAGVDSILKLLLRILRGIGYYPTKHQQEQHTDSSTMVLKSHVHLLFNVLLPLHKPSGMVLWRDQLPLIGLYHESLVKCIGCIVSLDKSLIGKVIQNLIHPDIWPFEGNDEGQKVLKLANTPKVILLLHEIDTLLGLLNICESSTNEDIPSNDNCEHISDTIVPLVIRLSSCISSDNSRASERALEFFKNHNFKALVKIHRKQVMTPLIRALCRINSGMEIPWNPTVQKMTLIVIRELQGYDNTQFELSCVEAMSKQNARRDKTRNVSRKLDIPCSIISHRHNESPTSDMMSVQKTMGSWKPPPKSSLKKSSTPPLTVTGVAPWSKHNMPQKKSQNKQPPLTVTGVAPWAVRPQSKIPNASTNPRGLRSIPYRSTKQSEHMKDNTINSFQVDTNDSDCHNKKEINALAIKRIEQFVSQLKQLNKGTYTEISDGESEWAITQMSESPLLLPTLKFHDLVFGNVLGIGSFSTVKYARQITKGKTRSFWPEFAVKIVSTKKIDELGYEQSINREIAILKMLSHPGISRLVSSFRFREGAYLVLEYASRGDLFSLLKTNGSLSEDSTQYVIGEVVASLHSIHELGLVYVDLKPENILITEGCHVKITDFGGCRALTDGAKKILKMEGQNLLKNLRDGDWRDSKGDNMIDDDEWNDTNNEDENNDEDIRIEGTTAYLPPEVILGSYPTFHTDSWALGCVLYQCLAGRPPLLDDSEVSTRQKIVSFAGAENDSSSSSLPNNDNFFHLDGKNGEAFSPNAKDLICKLLSPNPNARPDMTAISEHDFFMGKNIFTFYKDSSFRLDAGQVKPQQDAKWTRRQFSSIWAPQPQAYQISHGHGGSNRNKENSTDIIPEGKEKEGYFLAQSTSKRPMMIGIREGKE